MYRKIIRCKFNFSKLLIDYYNTKHKKEITDKGNYWCKKMLNINAY